MIDEIQRAPSLILAVKTAIDQDPRPGRFLLTGSANLMTLPRVADSLAQAELRGMPSSFLDSVFAGQPPDVGTPVVGDDLAETVLAGGFPEALGRSTRRRRRDWHLDYIEAIVQRDVRDVARVDQISMMPRLLRVLAEHSGQPVNYSRLGTTVGMNHVTTRKYLGILEGLFLVDALPSWRTSALKRLAKAPVVLLGDAAHAMAPFTGQGAGSAIQDGLCLGTHCWPRGWPRGWPRAGPP